MVTTYTSHQIVDRDNHRILIFSTDGELIQVIGDAQRPGFGIPFNHPTDVVTASNGDIFVSDGYGNSCVHHFDSTGKLIKSWGKPGKRPGEFSTPHAIWIDQQNRILVADRENNRIQIFNQNGDYLAQIEGLYHPMANFEDKNGLIYVTDQTPRLSVFYQKGSSLADAGHLELLVMEYLVITMATSL